MNVIRKNRSFEVEVIQHTDRNTKLSVFKELLLQINQEFDLIKSPLNIEIKYEKAGISHNPNAEDLVIYLSTEGIQYAYREWVFGGSRFWFREYGQVVEVFNRYFRENNLDEKITVITNQNEYQVEPPFQLTLRIISSERIRQINGNVISKIKHRSDLEFQRLKDIDDKIEWYEENEVFDNLSESAIQYGKKLADEYIFRNPEEVLRCFRYLVMPFEFGTLGSDYTRFIERLASYAHGKISISEIRQDNFDDHVVISCHVNGIGFKAQNLPTEISAEFILLLNEFLMKNTLYNFYWWKWDSEDQLNLIFMRNQYYRFYFRDYGLKGEFKELSKEVVEIHERRRIK